MNTMRIEMPEYVCAKHGDIGLHVLTSTIEGHEANFCLRCCIEKLEELGINKVQQKNSQE